MSFTDTFTNNWEDSPEVDPEAVELVLVQSVSLSLSSFINDSMNKIIIIQINDSDWIFLLT